MLTTEDGLQIRIRNVHLSMELIITGRMTESESLCKKVTSVFPMDAAAVLMSLLAAWTWVIRRQQ